MTLQQLKYIVAINRYRNFSKAADFCGITQPTLSEMLQKLEEELDIRIFTRTNKKVIPTQTGRKIIRQAEKTVAEAERINEIVADEKNLPTGQLRLAVSPSIASYILPEFIRIYIKSYPQIDLGIEEMKAENMLDALSSGIADIGIAVSNNSRNGIFEIPLYTERFYVYLSANCLQKLPVFRPENLEQENMWIVKEAQCLRDSAFSFCKSRTKGQHIYEAGNIETLIRIVDINGGYTIIPEMHLPLLSENQRANVRPIDGNHLSQRHISIYIREDFIRQGILNSVTETLKKVIPHTMLHKSILNNNIRL